MALTEQSHKCAAFTNGFASSEPEVPFSKAFEHEVPIKTHLRKFKEIEPEEKQNQLQQQKQTELAKQAKLASINNKNKNNQHKKLQRSHSPNGSSDASEQSDSSKPSDDDKGKQSNQQAATAFPVEPSPGKKLTIDCLFSVVKGIIAICDLVSQPIYYLKHEVNKKRREIDNTVRSAQVDPHDPSSPWRQLVDDERQKQLEIDVDSFETLDQMVSKIISRFSTQDCYGYRHLEREQWKKLPDTEKLQRQVRLSEYNWVSYEQFDRQVEAAKRGFLLEGVRAGDKVMLYADTRPEWQISAQALIRLGAVVGTMYATLGVDGIVHSVNETQVTHVVAQKDKVSRLLRLKSRLPKLKRIIHFDGSLQLPVELAGHLLQKQKQQQSSGNGSSSNNNTTSANGVDSKANNEDAHSTAEEQPALGVALESEIDLKDFEHPEVECISFRSLLARGVRAENNSEVLALEEECRKVCAKRTADSIVVIMYTSGSTGIPKGVLISHRNILATIKSFSYVIKDLTLHPKEHLCTAYLPLAHIFEFCIESLMLYHGIKYGFATPHTLTDKSPGLMSGQTGDLTLLQPTVMITVPLILDRIVQGVKQAVRGLPYFKRQLVGFLIDYKIKWQRRHYETPLVDKIVCTKMATALGGRVKYVISGSAPLSAETQIFVRAALNLKLPQGFGTTETCAATSCQLFDDQSTGNVGLPLAGTLIKLEPWIEGNYGPSDKPNPRGEILVGGDMIAHGYFNLDDQTAENFYVDAKGIRWYRTGDIGEFLPNGNLKIIDRKKDLVKLQNGEYISLGKVESTLKSNPFTENFCVYANSAYNYVVALGPVNEARIRSLVQTILEELQPGVTPEAIEQQQHEKKNDDERKALLRCMSSEKRSACLKELKELWNSYETDRINNNQAEPNTYDRKMSSLSTNSNAANCINERLQKLCSNKLIQESVLASIGELARERNLGSLEVPRKLLLLAEEWTEDKNLVTAAMKIRRNYIYKRYERELNQLYASAS